MKKYSGVSAILVGCLYLMTVVMILLSPPGESAVTDHIEHATKLISAHYFLGFLGLFGIAVVQMSSSLLNKTYEFLNYTKILAFLGFGLLCINNFRQTGMDHELAHQAFHQSGEYYSYTVFFWRGLVELSPQGWVDFGFVGVWLIALNFLYITDKTVNKYLSMLGLLLGICFVITVIGNVSNFSALTQVGMGLGGVILAPVYFVWLGCVILRDVPSSRASAVRADSA